MREKREEGEGARERKGGGGGGEREGRREGEREVEGARKENKYVAIITVVFLSCVPCSSTTIHVDFSQPCRVVRNILCRRYGVRHHYEYGLQYEGTGK